MLTRKMLNDRILEIVQIVHSSTQSTVNYYYIDIVSWESLTNPSASKQQGVFPFRKPMAIEDIEWCEKYHLPKVT